MTNITPDKGLNENLPKKPEWKLCQFSPRPCARS